MEISTVFNKDDFRKFAATLRDEKETWRENDHIFGTDYHESELAEYIVGAYDGNALIGCCYTKPTYVSNILEMGIVVKKHYQGQGIGNLMLTAIENKAKELNKTLVAKTIISNAPVNSLLLKHGWKIVEVYDDDGWQHLKK